MATEKVPCCPRCESLKGYKYSRRCLDWRVGSWNGVSDSSSIEYLTSRPATVRCLNCNARVANPEKDDGD